MTHTGIRVWECPGDPPPPPPVVRLFRDLAWGGPGGKGELSWLGVKGRERELAG